MTQDIFKGYDIRGKVGTELTTEISHNVGRAFADWLPTSGPVAVGRDMRPDSAELCQALIDGLLKQGREVWDLGLVTSDMSFFAVGKYNLAGSAMVTASHNPGAYNGIKLYRDGVVPVGLHQGLDVIRDHVLAKDFQPIKTRGTITQKNITEDWVTHALRFVSPSTWPPFRIAIDTGNGMAGAILPAILPKLPITVERLYFDLDGTFPNHEPDPHKEENLTTLIATIQKHGYDFGLAFDGDGDRVAFIDDRGRKVLGTDLVSLIAGYMLKQHPGANIVFEVRTSRATKELIEEWGGTPVCTKAGRVHIGTTVREVGAPFGGETTGHMFFHDNFDADSALISALVAIQALAATGKKLSEIIDSYRRYAMPPEINFHTSNEKVIDKLQAAFADGQQQQLDGLTVNYPDWWFNIRVSNTEHGLIRLNIEAANEALLQQKIAQIKQIVEA